MSYIVLGNLIALIASIIMVYWGFLKQKKKFYMPKQYKWGYLY